MDINVRTTDSSTLDRLDREPLAFGNIFSDHMLIRRWAEGAWGTAEIRPREPLAMDPTTLALHYGQTVFEGMKAYRGSVDGRLRLFRPADNARRLAQSCERLAIPPVTTEDFIACVSEMVRTEHAWVPHARGESLYIRPIIFASEQHIAVRPALEYLFVIVTAPVAPYFASGAKALRLKAEPRYTRAVPGGTGFAKTAGNYAATLRPMASAAEEGFDQILWLDANEHEFAEEAGQMNVFFRIGDEVITPDLSGTILPGVTRDSVLTLLKDWGVKHSERKVSVTELKAAASEGELKEMFGAGTAAVVAPIQSINYMGEEIHVSADAGASLTQRLLDTILGIQYGEIPDPHQWILNID